MKTRLFTQFAVVAVGAAGLLIFSGCPSTGSLGGGSGSGGTGGGAGTSGLLAGQVSSLSGKPIAGATVSLSTGLSASTDDNGFYSFSGLSSGSRVVASFRAPGFATTSKSLAVGGSLACILMAESADPVTINADSSSMQRSGDSAVTLSAGTLVDANGAAVTGNVELTATFLDSSGDGVMAFPGSFDDAERMTGGMTTLESFGFAIYELTQNGATVNLAPGSTADIEYVLPGNAQARFTVGDTIPLWEFVDATAMWQEAGTGTIGMATDGSGRLAWFATVNHFSSWNCDAPLEDKTCLSGRVVYNDIPVGGAEIAGVGVDYNGTSIVRTSSDGTFCVNVKRGAMVQLEVRLNGSATPIVVQAVTASDVAADCATGTCTDLGDIVATLDACVTGTVLDATGAPVGGVTVFVVPGETTTTASDGTFCAAAVSGREVFVFAQGRPSVSVQTTGSGTCGGSSCAQANLSLTLPGDGDDVGSLFAQTLTLNSALIGTTSSFSLTGSFLTVDAADIERLALAGSDLSGSTSTTQEFGSCTVTVQTSTFTSSDVPDPSSFDFGGFGALDPGAPGVASNGTASVNLLRGDPNATDPPQPFLAGVFSPDEGPDELATLGFAGGQTLTFTFPGGADIGPFTASIGVPDDIVVTTPDLTATALTLDTTSTYNLVWVADTSGDTVTVTLTRSTSDLVTNADGSITSTSNSTLITCEFTDDGTGTIPAGAMVLLPAEGTSSTTTVGFSRNRTTTVLVPLRRVVGNGVVRVTGSSSATGVFTSIAIPGIPDLPDVCSFITCPDGQVCNPATFMCEPM